MKKTISILLLLLFFGSNISFGYNNCEPRPECEDPLYQGQSTNFGVGQGPKSCNPACTSSQICDTKAGTCVTKPVSQTGSTGGTAGSAGAAATKSVMGITCDETTLMNGQCKLNIYDTLGIRQSVRNEGDPTSVGLFVQDVILSTTFFIGTLITVALIVSGLMFIFAASSGKDPANAKKGIMGSLVGLLIVVSSYVIIRLVQYIAKGF